MSQLGPLIVDLDGDLSLTAADRERLSDPRIGGVILFSRNYQSRAQLRVLTKEIKALRAPALLITVDQEGGRVQRFREEFTRLPTARTCGNLYDLDPRAGMRLARYAGLVMARELIDCGVDLSFAPVLDILSRDSQVIGDRAFHSDPGAVHALAKECIGGMHDAGMGSIGKHFPGHGGVEADSHTCLPDDHRSMAEIQDCDLQPYKSLAQLLQGVMLAHVRYGTIDSLIPSYSAFWVRDVLRKEIGFTGVVFSDDLSMAGAGKAPLPERCLAAFKAGCDMLPVCNDLDAVDGLLNEREEKWTDFDATMNIASLYARPRYIDSKKLAAARESLERAAEGYTNREIV